MKLKTLKKMTATARENVKGRIFLKSVINRVVKLSITY